jgi:SOS-response transcriptional repressor LexA
MPEALIRHEEPAASAETDFAAILDQLRAAGEATPVSRPRGRGRPPHAKGPLTRKRIMSFTEEMDDALIAMASESGAPVLEVVRRMIERELSGYLPVLGSIPCGDLQEALQECRRHLQPGTAFGERPGDFWLEARGESMTPEINDGDLVLIRPNIPWAVGDICAVQIFEHEGMQGAVTSTLKRVYHPEPATVVLKGANPAWVPITTKASHVQILGVMKGLARVY